MNASVAICLAAYCTFSLLIAFYAFRLFRKKNESVTFSVFGAFVLFFVWCIPAVQIIKKKITAKKLV